MTRVITQPQEITAEWLSDVLMQEVASVDVRIEASNWSSQVPLTVRFRDSRSAALRLKICSGEAFGPSEVDYYLKDYADLAGAPLVRCRHAAFDPAIGYHLLLDDLSATHSNRRDVIPTRAYGLAVAEALARMHRHHWQSRPAPEASAVSRYLDESRSGITVLASLTGRDLSGEAMALEHLLRQRLGDPRGMSLLHGDLNSMNVLTPKGCDTPVLFIDRQPFDWSLTYAPAVHDLAYFLVLWWPEDIRAAHEAEILRHWHEGIGDPSYTWDMAVSDWQLAVRQCLHVPFEWCSKPETAQAMRWLWEMQLSRILSAITTAQEI